MTKPKPKGDLFGSPPSDYGAGKDHGAEKHGPPPPKVQGGYTGRGGPNPKPPTTGSGVAPAKSKTAAAKPSSKKHRRLEAEQRKRESAKPPRVVAAKKTGTAVAVAPPPAPVNLLSLVGQALVNPAVDAAKLTTLVDWYDKREADNAFARDFLAMAKKLPEIKRDGTIDQGITRSGRQGVKAKYATFENIHEATSGILHDHGFTLSTRNAIQGEQTVVILRLEHYDTRFGSSFRESVQPIQRDDGPGKTVVQAWGSGEQYQLRRMVIKLLNLRSRAAIDEDRDGHPPKADPSPEKNEAKPINAKALAELRAAIKDCGVTEQAVLDKYGLAKLEEMTVAVLPDALKACANFKAARNG